MELKEIIQDKSLFIDTAPIIYFVEGSNQYESILEYLFDANDAGEVLFQSSLLTLLEVLVQPLKYNRKDLAYRYEEFLTGSPNMSLYPINLQIVKMAADLRATYNIQTPDSIQIATSIVYDSDYFLTNDVKLKRVSEVHVLTLRDITI